MQRDSQGERLRLGAGETRLMQVAQGTVVKVQGAPVTLIESPVWQGGILLQPCHHLRTGDAFAIVCTGWIVLSASGQAYISFCSPASRAYVCRPRWRNVAARVLAGLAGDRNR